MKGKLLHIYVSNLKIAHSPKNRSSGYLKFECLTLGWDLVENGVLDSANKQVNVFSVTKFVDHIFDRSIIFIMNTNLKSVANWQIIINYVAVGCCIYLHPVPVRVGRQALLPAAKRTGLWTATVTPRHLVAEGTSTEIWLHLYNTKLFCMMI